MDKQDSQDIYFFILIILNIHGKRLALPPILNFHPVI